MKEAKIYYADCETTGLLYQLVEQGKDAKLHNFCAMSVDTDRIYLLHDTIKLKKFLDRDIILVMHNGICYDNNALIHFGFDTSRVHYVDTLALSWYLDLKRSKHGLESYGEEAGVPKPVIDDWEKLTQKDYDNRVIEDVKIQRYTYQKLKRMFEELYGDLTDYEFCTHKVVKYLNFKMKQLSEQQNTGFKINIEKAKGHIQEYAKLIDEKTEQLASVMPKVPKYAIAKPPSKPYKADGSLSATGLKWKGITESVGVDMDFDEPIKVLKCYEEPNPSSPQQLKDWLFGLGWMPQTYKFDKDADGNEKKIPQIYLPQSGGQICPSIERLAEDVPEVNALVGLGVVKHRKGAIQGFMDSLIHNEYIEAGANGFTNTLRLKHRKPFCNLPSSRVPYGLDVRGCLVARDHKVLGGADLSSLENRIKFNLQLPYDRDYVLSQMSDDFDPHLDIACEGGLVTQDQVNFYKIVKEGFEESRYEMTDGLLKLLAMSDDEKEIEIKVISKARGKGKNTNYGCQYGAGASTVARTAGVPLSVGKALVGAYKSLNWSIEKIASSQTVKKTSHGDYQLNPFNGIWYHLKTDKDRFSTLVQGTGSYILDLWLSYEFKIREQEGLNLNLLATAHDEQIIEFDSGLEEQVKGIISKALDKVNERLNLEIKFGCDIQFGTAYSDIH